MKFFYYYLWLLSSSALSFKSSIDTILVAGARGKTGREVVYQALKKGVNVVALSRGDEGLFVPPGSGQMDGISTKTLMSDLQFEGNLNIVVGDATNPDDVAKCFYDKPIGGVVMALGGNTQDVGKRMNSLSTANILVQMSHYGIKRIAAVTSVGTGDSYEQAPLFFKGLMATIYKDMFEDKNIQEDTISKTDTEWCIVRPGGLTNGRPLGNVTPVVGGTIGNIARADVANFCLDAVLKSTFQYRREKVSICNVKNRYSTH